MLSSSTPTISESIDQTQNSIYSIHVDLHNLKQQKVREKYQELHLQQMLQKSLHSLEQSTSNSTPMLSLSENERKKFEMNSPDIRALIVDKVLYTGEMTWENAMVPYKVSRSSIARMIAEEKNEQEWNHKTSSKKTWTTFTSLCKCMYLLVFF